MGGLVRTVRDFEVFKLAYQLALEIHTLSHNMPKTEQYGGMADQMRRASKGICANLAEGFGKNSSAAEFRRFVQMALGSANEMVLWLEFSADLKLIEEENAAHFRTEYGRVCMMLQRLSQSKK